MLVVYMYAVPGERSSHVVCDGHRCTDLGGGRVRRGSAQCAGRVGERDGVGSTSMCIDLGGGRWGVVLSQMTNLELLHIRADAGADICIYAYLHIYIYDK